MKVNWDDYSQYMGEKKGSKPPTSVQWVSVEYVEFSKADRSFFRCFRLFLACPEDFLNDAPKTLGSLSHFFPADSLSDK